MAELLLELFSEEIPARFQPRAEQDLARLLKATLEDQHLSFKTIETFSTPRRLTARVTDLALSQPAVREERRGPRADAPEKAIQGFLSSVGLTRDQVEERETPKGRFLFAVINRKGRRTAEVLADILPDLVYKFPWPKSMRWGKEPTWEEIDIPWEKWSQPWGSSFRWVRPLHKILCILDGEIVDFYVHTIRSGNTTEGHRFLAPKPFAVKNFADYQNKLRKAYVQLSADERKKVIHDQARKLAKSKGLTLIEDEALLEEVAGMTEWPVALLGGFDRSFLDVPEEVLVAAMRHHLKFFPLRKGGKLAPHFISIANTKTADGGKQIIAGNERVLAARLSDAKFFWDQDVKVPLEKQAEKLSGIVFHEKLGTVADRVERIGTLAEKIAGFVPGCDPKKAKRAARLAKADLVSGMVGEFPELQGIMGYYYAREQDEGNDIAEAIRDQYSPKGPSDDCPKATKAPVSVALALAENLEKLISFWSINEKPTGSKDPFALRRAALSAIRLIVVNELRIQLQIPHNKIGVSGDLMAFLADRLKVQQKEKGTRHDLIDAVFSLGHEDDLVRILNRVSALQKFLKTKDGENLLAGYKRAVNIVRIEETKDSRPYLEKVDPKLLTDKDEIALYKALEVSRKAIDQAIMEEDFEGAMTAVAKLRGPIDAFFDNVTVNVENVTNAEKIRENRLRLLAGIRIALIDVADFSKIEG